MDDLINRRAAIDVIGEVHPLDYNAQAIKSRIESLPSAPQWIPCSERLPERSGNYLITRDIIEGYEKEACSIDYFEADTLCWDGYDNLVIAWMPLPEAYKKE